MTTLATHPYASGTDRLTDYVWRVLASLADRQATGDLLPEERGLLDYVTDTRDFSPVVARALMLIADDIYPVGSRDKPSAGDGRPRALDQEAALVLYKQYGTLRAITKHTGISKSALQRAITQNYQEAA